jgi:hypothetical protein
VERFVRPQEYLVRHAVAVRHAGDAAPVRVGKADELGTSISNS